MEGRYKGSTVKSAILLSLLLLFSLLFLWSMPYYEGEACVFFPRGREEDFHVKKVSG